MSIGEALERSTASSVEVGLDVDTAFRAFTEELDLWWVRGPINHHAGGRVLAMRLECRPGGRLLEVYDDETGDALELARVVEWQPPARVRWRSSIDDVETEVSFDPTPAGTLVRVVATIPASGTDNGGTAWVRVVPTWFSRWAARRESVPHVVRDISRLALTLSCRRPFATARWLRDAFGFEPMLPLPEGDAPAGHGDHAHPWIELRVGDASLVVEPMSGAAHADAPPPRPSAQTHVPWVYVEDLDAHLRRAEAHGAAVIEPVSSPWGLPFYVAEDVEGNRWTFAQARPTMR